MRQRKNENPSHLNWFCRSFRGNQYRPETFAGREFFVAISVSLFYLFIYLLFILCVSVCVYVCVCVLWEAEKLQKPKNFQKKAKISIERHKILKELSGNQAWKPEFVTFSCGRKFERFLGVLGRELRGRQGGYLQGTDKHARGGYSITHT